MKNNLLETVQKNIAQHALLQPGEKVLIAFSGGFDSVCLALCLKELGYEIGLAHMHHGLRETADWDVAFCKDFAEKLQVPFHFQKTDVESIAAAQKISIETAGRNARYAFLQATPGYNKIATGHHKNDLAETVIQHLIRGSGLKGLCGISPKRGNIVRPLLDVTRAEIEAFVTARGITPCMDETNDSLDYNRNRIRLELLPLMQKENPSALENISRTAQLLTQDEAFLMQTAKAYVQENKLNMRTLQTLHPAIAGRALRLAYTFAAGTSKDFEQKHIAYILEHLKEHGEILNLCFNVVCKAEYGTLVFEKKQPPCAFCYAVKPDCTLFISEIERTFTIFLSDRPQAEHYFDYSTLQNKPLYLRSVQPEDKFYPFGMDGGKPLNKTMIDLKIPVSARLKTPLLATDFEILSIVGMKRSRFYKTKDDTQIYLNIREEFHEERN